MREESSVGKSTKKNKKELTAVIERARSVHEIEAWLRSRECVRSVGLTDYLLKSNPPQRELIVEFNTRDGAVVTKIINIFDLGDGQFQFHGLRDP